MFQQQSCTVRAADATRLDLLTEPAAVFDGTGALLHANAAAWAILGHGETLALANGRLTARNNPDRRLLRRLIALAARGTDGLCTLPRRGGAHPLQIMLLALPDARVLLRIHAPSHRAGPPEACMRRRFGLTAREAELAVRFAEGATLHEAAERMGLAPAQAQALQARVLARTGRTAPADLSALLDTIL